MAIDSRLFLKKILPKPLFNLIRDIAPTPIIMAWRARRALATEPELRALISLSSGRVFVDVGANAGVWSQAAARSFRSVHAFEPDRVYASKARSVLPHNVIVHNSALSDTSGPVEFFVPIFDGERHVARASLEGTANGATPFVPQTVQRERLDDLRIPDIDVIKIDVEGHEMAVLRGAEKTILEQHPTLIVEIAECHHPGKSEDIINWVCARGYDCFHISGTEGGFTRFLPGSIARLQAKCQPGIDELDDDYVCNFLFLPLERSDLFTRLGIPTQA